MAQATAERADGYEPPSWWVEAMLNAMKLAKKTNEALGRECAAAIGRSTPWDGSAISRYMNNKNRTREMTYGLAIVLVIPPPFFEARDMTEAASLQAVMMRRNSSASPSEKSLRKGGVVDQLLEGFEETAERQGSAVESKDERGTRGRRTGRAATRRASSS